MHRRPTRIALGRTALGRTALGRITLGRIRITLAAVLAGALLAVLPFASAPVLADATIQGPCTASDWPMFGHDAGRSFASDDTCISTVTAATLRPKWFVNTSSPVTAQPVVSGGVVYAGDFAGTFHAIDAATGTERWTFNALAFDKDHTDYGVFPDSAAVATVHGHRVVVVGGGATLFILDAASGTRLASLCLDRVDITCQGGTGYTTEIESSPVVIPHGNGAADILVGTDVNEHDPSGPTGLYDITLDANAATLTPKWMFDPETGVTWPGLPTAQASPGSEHGCGDVWSSPTIVGSLAVFGVGNCNHPAAVPPPNVKQVESTLAVNVSDGTLAWQAVPHAPGNGLDLDFGATPNALGGVGGGAAVGEGGKDGVYYAYTGTGALAWKTTVATASDVGGMVASTATGRLGALHGNHPAVFAATAIPVSTADPQGSITNDVTHPTQAFGLHAVDAVTHQVVWDAPLPPAFGAATYDNGVVFVPDTVLGSMVVLDADTGAVLRVQPLNSPPSSPVAISGNSVYIGAGTTESGPPLSALSSFGGIWGFTTTP